MRRYFWILFSLVLSLVFFVGFVSAAGVSPAYYVVNFEPNFEGEFSFNFNFGKGATAETYVAGALTEYVELDKDVVEGSGNVVALLKLPEKIDEPGTHRIRIGAKQLPSEEGGIEVIGDVGGIIKVNVPYPGSYAEAQLSVGNSNAGEDVEMKLIVHNKGSERIFVSPVIEIERVGGFREGVEISEGDRFIEGFELEGKWIDKAGSAEFMKNFSSEGYLPGVYNLKAVTNYGGEELVVVERFMLGEFYVGIFDYTKSFERDSINRFNIGIESFYDGLIEEVYANVTILDQSFLTPSVSLGAFENISLEGFLDTEGIGPTKFDGKIVLHYGDGRTEEIVRLRFEGEIERIWYFVGGAAIAIIVGLIFMIWRFKWFRKKGRK